MSTDPAATPALTTLRESWARQRAVIRWLSPLAPLVMLVVTWAACTTDPRPGLAGRHLAVALAVCSFALAGAGAIATLGRRRRLHIGFVATQLATSVTLVWLQPNAAGVAGVFVGVSLLAPLLRGHRSVPLIVVALITLDAMLAAGRGGSVTEALLSAIMLSGFYGTLFLAMRLGEANQLAERLLIELERGRAAQARAAGLAERQRLAREMHDVLAHALSGLMLQLEGARMLAARNPGDARLPDAINRAHHLGKTGLEEARRAIGTLRDDELPGPERLAKLATQFQRDRGVPCLLTVSGEAHRLASDARLALYRVAQEALTNVAKHARPERVELRLEYEPTATRLTVEDFGPPPAGPGNDGGGGGYGLTGMRERAELLDGTLTTAATPSGFRVELAIPA